MRLITQSHEDVENVSRLLDLVDVDLVTYKLISDGGYMIELLHFRSHYLENRHISLPYVQGITHFAMNVESISNTLSLYKMHGFHDHYPISSSPGSHVKVAYTKGPEGVLIELVEE